MLKTVQYHLITNHQQENLNKFVMNPTKNFLTFLIAILSMVQLHAQCPGTTEEAILHFDFDACMSNTSEGTNQDYSEFTAVSNNPNSCASPEVIGGHLYRNNPQQFVHSCTPGVDDTPGMCVSAIRECILTPNTNYEVRFDLQLSPQNGGFIMLNSLNFYEMAPAFFDWIGGASGVNDNPTLYSVRIFANNLEVFSSMANQTSPYWSLQSFDFSGNPAFVVSSPTMFSFELVAYCPVGNGGPLSVWDLDEISISTTCSFQETVSGGVLVGGPFEFCVGDDVDDILNSSDVSLSGNSGSNSMYLLTGNNGNILAVTTDISTLNFDIYNPGSCMLWHVAHEDNFSGATLGSTLAQLMGCFELSNPIMVTKLDCTVPCEAMGGTLSSPAITICIDDDNPDFITPADLGLSGNIGSNNQWVVTDVNGNITALPASISDINFEGSPIGQCLIWNLAFEDDLTGAAIGNNANDLMGCFSLSNPVQVTKEECVVDCEVTGGMISGGPFEFCANDGVDDFIAIGQLVLSGNMGGNSQWLVTDNVGNIIGLPNSFTDVNFEIAGLGSCLLYHLSYENGLTGLVLGTNVNQLIGCFDLSNPITVNRIDCETPCDVEGGMLAGGPYEYCIGDGDIDFIKDGQIVQFGASGSNSQWVFTDENDNILELPTHYTELDFDGYAEGICYIYYMTYEDGLQGLNPGTNLADLDGCFDVSNTVTIIKTDCTIPCMPVGGNLIGGPFNFCLNDGNPDTIAATQYILEDEEGPLNQFVIITADGTIQALPANITNFDFMSLGLGSFQLLNMSFDPGLLGLTVGNNIPADIDGCWGISNSIPITNQDCTTPCGASASVLTGGPFSFCVGDNESDFIDQAQIAISGGSGPMSTWLLTDSQGIIQSLPANYADVDFNASPVGNCLLWELNFEPGIVGLNVGANANTLSGCFALSNSISIAKTNCGTGEDDCPEAIINTLFGILDNNLVVLDQEVGTIKEVKPLTGGFSPNYGGFTYHAGDGQYYAIAERNTEPTLVTIDVNNGQVNLVGVITETSGNLTTITIAESLEYNPNDGNLYITLGDNSNDLANNFFSRNLFTINTTTAVASYVAPTSGACQDEADGLVYLGGTMYYTDGCPNPISFGTIDVVTGQQTEISTISSVQSTGRMAADPATGIIYYFDSSGRSLYTIDVDGNLSLIGISYADGVFDELMDEIAFGPRLASNTFGGIILGGQFTFCISDDEADFFEDGELQLFSEYGPNSQWVVTNDDSEILVLPNNFTDVDFGGLTEDICFVWHLSFDSVMGLTVGESLSELSGCYDLSNPIIVEKVIDGPECFGLTETSNDEINFAVIPNPIEDKLNIVKLNLKDELGTITIFDLNGKVLIQQAVSSTDLSINTSSLPNGVFIASLRSGNEVISKRFMKLK